MIFSIIVLVLLFAVGYFQSIQGFFSALIMTVLTVCCAAIAFGFYEWSALELAALEPRLANYAHAISLGALFGIPLFLLRLAFDKLIKRDCLLPLSVDRAGAGVCGVVTSFVLVGTMALALQMVPFGESILGFARFETAPFRVGGGSTGKKPPPPNAEENELCFGLKPDRFASRFAGVLSDGVFNGVRSFHSDHPNLPQEIGWVNTLKAEVLRTVPSGSIGVLGTEPVPFLYRLVSGEDKGRAGKTPDEYEALPVDADRMLQAVRVELKRPAQDPKRKSHEFTLRQFRIVGQTEGRGPTRQYFPVAMQQADETQPVNRHVRFKKDGRGDWPVTEEIVLPREGGQVEIVFELPKRFTPSFLEYKRGARANVKFLSEEDAAKQGGASKPAEPKPAAAPPSAPIPPSAPSERGGRRGRREGSTTAEESGSSGSADKAHEGGRDSAGSTGTPSPTPAEPAKPSGDSTSTAGARGEAAKTDRVRRLTARAGESYFGDDLPLVMRSYRGQNDFESGQGKLQSGHLVGEVEQQESGNENAISKFDVPQDKRLLHLSVTGMQARSGLGRAISFAVGTLQNYIVEDTSGRQYLLCGKYAAANVGGRNIVEVQYFPEHEGAAIGGLGKFEKIQEDQIGKDGELVLLFLVEPGAQIASFSTGSSATRRDDLRGENLVAPK